MRDAARRIVVGVADGSGVLAAWFREAHAVAALVRPDRYVFGSAGNTVGLVRLLEELKSAFRVRLSMAETR